MNKTQVSWLREYFPDLALVRLPVFGSRREFYRINAGQESKIVIVDRDREQFQLWLDRAELFSSLNVNVPRAEVFSEELDLIITQDLGAASVESLAQQAKTDRLQYYHQVIEVLVKWQLRFKRVPELAQQHRLRQYDFEYARSEIGRAHV